MIEKSKYGDKNKKKVTFKRIHFFTVRRYSKEVEKNSVIGYNMFFESFVK